MPTEEQIVQALAAEPSPEFYQRMAKMPWKRSTSTWVAKRLMTAAAVFAALTLTVLAVPPLRMFAQEIIDTLFRRAESNTTTFEYDPAATDSPQAAFQFNGIEAAEAAFGIDMLAPTLEIEGYQIGQVYFDADEQTYTLEYTAPPGRGLLIMGSAVSDDPNDVPLIGADAPITPVEITTPRGVFAAQYVIGLWAVDAAAVDIRPTPNAEGLIEQEAEWIPDASLRRLRWQEAGWFYEVIAMGGSGDLPDRDLMQDDLIALAESMG